MPTLLRSPLRTAAIAALLILTGVGCASRHRVDPSLPPLSTEPLAPGDKITHINGEPVNDQAGDALRGVQAQGDVVYTVKRQDGRIERLGPARLNPRP
jgi:hypothetical protein